MEPTEITPLSPEKGEGAKAERKHRKKHRKSKKEKKSPKGKARRPSFDFVSFVQNPSVPDGLWTTLSVCRVMFGAALCALVSGTPYAFYTIQQVRAAAAIAHVFLPSRLRWRQAKLCAAGSPVVSPSCWFLDII